TQTTVLVNHVPGFGNSTGDGGIPSDDHSPARPPSYLQPVISADGNFVAFVSADTNLVPGQGRAALHGYLSVYLYDRRTDQIKLVSDDPSLFANGYFWDPVLSADGHYV